MFIRWIMSEECSSASGWRLLLSGFACIIDAILVPTVPCKLSYLYLPIYSTLTLHVFETYNAVQKFGHSGVGHGGEGGQPLCTPQRVWCLPRYLATQNSSHSCYSPSKIVNLFRRLKLEPELNKAFK